MSAKSRGGMLAGIAIIVILVLIFGSWYIRTRNRLVALDEQINSAWAEIDNQLQRRSDLIPNLVATVRGFANQELEVFTNIADARARLAGANTVEETAEGYNELQGALSRLLVVVENYPQLKSNENFIRLQDELAETVEAYWDAIAVPDPGCHWCEDKRHDMCPKHTCENPGPDFCPWAVHERCCLHVCGEDER